MFFSLRPRLWAYLITGSLTAFLMLNGCGRHSTTGIFVDPAFGPLVSPDTQMLAGIRLDKIRDTPLYKKLNGRFDLQSRLDVFSQRTGLDPRKDLWQLLIASEGKETVIMARGRFTVGELEPHLDALGKERTPYKDYSLVGSPETSVVFLNPGVAVAGSQNALRRLIDRREGANGIPKQIADRLAAMPADDQLWMVDTAGVPSTGLLRDRSDVSSLLSNLVGYIKTTQIGVKLDDGVHLKAEVDCISPEGAQRVHDAIKGGIGLARLSTRNDQMDMLKLYDGVTVATTNTNVAITADAAGELIDRFLTNLPNVRQQVHDRLDQLPK